MKKRLDGMSLEELDSSIQKIDKEIEGLETKREEFREQIDKLKPKSGKIHGDPFVELR